MSSIFGVKKSSNLWLKLPIKYRGAIIISLPAICLMLTLGSWIWLRQTFFNVNYQMANKEAIIAKSNHLLQILVDAETGIRGYTISNEKRYLYPYNQAIATIESSLDNIEQLLISKPQQSEKIKEIKKLTQQQLTILKQWLILIDQKPINSNSSSQINSLLAQGKEAMDALRTSLDNLKSQEQILLDVYKNRSEKVKFTIICVQLTASLVSIIACSIAICLFNQLLQELTIREQQLWKSKSLIELITTNIVDSIVTFNQQGNIETFNLAATKMFGYEPEEIAGQKLALLLINPLSSEQNKLKNIDLLANLFLSLEHSWETIGYHKSGNPFSIEISVSQIDLDGYWIAIIRDISGSKKAQAELQARTEELTYLSKVLATTNHSLKKQNQELDQFVYVASHDLKAPLRAIANLSEWIEEDLAEKLPQESSQQMQLLRERVYRLQSLIDGLLAYSRIGRSHSFLETFNVEELLKEIIKTLAPPSSFTIKISPEMPILRAKKRLLRQVFSNLIDNAIKHHYCPVGCVQISVQDQGNFYQFAITDDGPGIAQDFHKKVFILFQTVFARDVKENTGIGLTIARKIVETEGGKIWLKSEEGAGATFYFTWPKNSNG